MWKDCNGNPLSVGDLCIIVRTHLAGNRFRITAECPCQQEDPTLFNAAWCRASHPEGYMGDEVGAMDLRHGPPDILMKIGDDMEGVDPAKQVDRKILEGTE